MPLSIRPTGAAVGAFVSGLDFRSVSKGQAAELYRAFLEFGVLVFKGMKLNIDDQIKLSTIFGEMQVPHELAELRLSTVPGIREIASNGGKPVAADDPDADKVIGQIPWHSDKAYIAMPSRGALLRAVVVPEKGGQTGWIDTVRVYRSLPYAIKCKIQGLRIIHSFDTSHSRQSAVKGGVGVFPDAIHPLVSVHPEIDQPVINISPATATRIVGLPEAEAAELMEELIRLATREEDAYVHHWEPGDVVAWDNWRALHRAYGHPKRYPRLMHSLQLKGEMLIGEQISRGGDPSGQAAA
jgi:taurine dioxygenase